MQLREIDEVAIDALRERIAKATVYIIDGARREPPRGLGSGTVLLTPGGRLVVLTARHLFDRNEATHHSCRVCWYRNTDSLEPFTSVRVEHPTSDVALLLVPGSHEGPMREYALPSADVLGWYGRRAFDDNVFLTGYPEKLVDLKIDHARRKGTMGFTAIAYTANVKDLGRDDLGRLTLPWREMVFGRDPTIHELPSPKGMSGGGLWYFDPAQVLDGVWEPSKFLRVIGVQSMWFPDDRVALIEGSDRWHDWFVEAIAAVDAFDR